MVITSASSRASEKTCFVSFVVVVVVVVVVVAFIKTFFKQIVLAKEALVR